MMNSQIAAKIALKVASLVSFPISVLDSDGNILASEQSTLQGKLNVGELKWAVPFNYQGEVVGYVSLNQELPNHESIAPLIKSIAELVMHQSILIDQIPKQEERLDKYVYDLLHHTPESLPTLVSQAQAFNLELERPRIAIVIAIEDPLLTTSFRAPSNDRDTRISRYKAGISRALHSYYTSSRDNIVVYIGENRFCILKDLQSESANLQENLESFKKSIHTIYEILKSEIKLPTTVGIGNFHNDISGIKQSFEEACSAIELGEQVWHEDRVYHIDDFGVVAPLLSGIDEKNIYFSRELLEKLGENSEIIQTLEVFFEHDMSLTTTADILGLHRNTLVYRLDRIHETLGLDPRVFDDAVQIKLAILFTKFIEGAYAHQ